MRRRRQDTEPESRLRWERGADWSPAAEAGVDFGGYIRSRAVLFALVILSSAVLLKACDAPPEEQNRGFSPAP